MKDAAPCLQRRLLLGVLASVGLGAFALVPTQELQLSKPSKPLFFYLVPLLR
jgi:A/G-specific adenine glycosylase